MQWLIETSNNKSKKQRNIREICAKHPETQAIIYRTRIPANIFNDSIKSINFIINWINNLPKVIPIYKFVNCDQILL